MSWLKGARWKRFYESRSLTASVRFIVVIMCRKIKSSFLKQAHKTPNKISQISFTKSIANTVIKEGVTSIEDLFDAFNKQLNHFIDIKIRGNNIIERIFSWPGMGQLYFESILERDYFKKS